MESVMTSTHAAADGRTNALTGDPIPGERSRSSLRPFSAVRLAMITGWMPGDSYVWVGSMPVPVSRNAWREIGQRLLGRRTY